MPDKPTPSALRAARELDRLALLHNKGDLALSDSELHRVAAIIEREMQEAAQAVLDKNDGPADSIHGPWQHPALLGWSIIGLNHYYVNNCRHLFVAMGKDGHFIKAEGQNELAVWTDLVEQANSQVSARAAIAGEGEK